MARTPPVFRNSDAPSHAHIAADAMAPMRRYRTPNFVFTLAREERLVARFALDAGRTIRRCRGGWWRSRWWRLTRGHSADGRVAFALLAITSYRVLLFVPATESSPHPLHDSPYEVCELPLETLHSVRAVDGLLDGGEGILELGTVRGERLVVPHLPDAAGASKLIGTAARGYLCEDDHVRPHAPQVQTRLAEVG
ncbi:MAG: hypothetical protein ACYC3Q_05170 [Gemmatimonadaceae bacterium]